MSLAHLQPVTDTDEYIMPARSACDPASEPEPTAAPHHPRHRLLAWVLVVVTIVVAGGVAAWWMLRPQDSAAAPEPTITAPPAAPAGISGFAELYVATYLTGTGEGSEDALDAFTGEELALDGMVPHTRYVVRAETIDLNTRTEGYWTATVATEVLDLSEDGYVPAGLQFYAVAIVKGESGFAAVGLPSRVSPPKPSEIGGVARVEADPTADQQIVAAGFLDALLTGTTEIGRFLTPESHLLAIDPPPYTSIEMTDLRTATVADLTYLRAVVAVTSASGHRQNLEYTLELAHNSRVWLVHAMYPGPPPLAEG